MKEIEIEIKTTLSQTCRAIDTHTVTAYADDRFPGLAIHKAWDFFDDNWRVTHVPSGLTIATLPTRAAATIALEAIGRLQDWNRPQEAVVPAEPGEFRWLRTSIAGAISRIEMERAAALKAAVVESGTIKAAALEAALSNYHCRKMHRAWRTRSNVTRSKWTEPARALLGEAASLTDVWTVAALLYAAASDFSPAGKFEPAALDLETWKMLSDRLQAYHANPPDKALSRGQYDEKHRVARATTTIES